MLGQRRRINRRGQICIRNRQAKVHGLVAVDRPMQGTEIEEIAHDDLRTLSAQCLRALVVSSRHRPHRVALLQQQFSDRPSYCAAAPRRARNLASIIIHNVRWQLKKFWTVARNRQFSRTGFFPRGGSNSVDRAFHANLAANPSSFRFADKYVRNVNSA